MAEIDPRVARLNSSINSRLDRFQREQGHRSGAAGDLAFNRKWMRDHQPEAGEWGAPCLGHHDEPTHWPCSMVREMDTDRFYWDL